MNLARRFNWGVGIGVTYAAFVVGTTSFVIFALGQPVELVSADYYSRSLTYDQQIDAARQADGLGETMGATRSDDGRSVIVRLPRAQAQSADVSGTLTLYRPSSVGADRVVPLAVDAVGTQRVSLDGLARGRWILKMDWQAQGRRYYREQAIEVNHVP
jgi:nitrogen fixation protein FixH